MLPILAAANAFFAEEYEVVHVRIVLCRNVRRSLVAELRYTVAFICLCYEQHPT